MVTTPHGNESEYVVGQLPKVEVNVPSGIYLPSGLNVDTLKLLLDERQAALIRFADERDRRYREVATERQRAMTIKETADLAALTLASDIQKYKDEKANQLREQIERERGTYATREMMQELDSRLEALIYPLTKYVTERSGAESVKTSQWRNAAVLIAFLGLAFTLMVFYLTGGR